MPWFWNLVLFWSGRIYKQIQNCFLPKVSCKSQSKWSVSKTEPFHPGCDLSKFDRNILRVGKQKLMFAISTRSQCFVLIFFFFKSVNKMIPKLTASQDKAWCWKKGHFGIKNILFCFSVAVSYGEFWTFFKCCNTVISKPPKIIYRTQIIHET